MQSLKGLLITDIFAIILIAIATIIERIQMKKPKICPNCGNTMTVIKPLFKDIYYICEECGTRIIKGKPDYKSTGED